MKSFGVKSISIPAQHTLLEYTTARLTVIPNSTGPIAREISTII